MKKIISSVIILIFIILKTNAQIQKNEQPLGLKLNLSTLDLQQITTDKLDYKTLEDEDKQDELNNTPPRFGYPQDVTINTSNSGTWLKINNDNSIWRLKINCPDALSINLLFSKFHLLPNTKMFIYANNSKQMQGAFTELNNKGTYDYPRKFATGLYYGNEIIIELDVPTENIGNDIFEIAKVVHGYRYINVPNFENKSNGAGFGVSGNCEVNINCPEGIDWQNEKRGVAMILVDGNRECTGSLINNTCNDGKLYFLTANHCTQLEKAGFQNWDAVNNNDLSSWSFIWNYESKDCSNPQAEPTLFTTNGATLIANNSTSDFALLELTESPIEHNYPVYFNGWSLSQNPITGGVCIHHPSGDIKKISTYKNISNGGISFGANHWNVSWVNTVTNLGVTEGGSSGSPLFNNKKIIGQLHGGPSKCGATGTNLSDDYGQFHISWDNSSTIERQLKNWLAVCNTDIKEMDGGYVDNCQNVDIYITNPITNKKVYYATNKVEANSKITSTANVEMYANNEIIWNDGFNTELGAEVVAEIKPCTPAFVVGMQRKKDTPENEFTSFSEDFFIYPNPSQNIINIRVGNNYTNSYILILSIQGNILKKINEVSLIKNQDNPIDISELPSGVYLLKIVTNNNEVIKKITKI